MQVKILPPPPFRRPVRYRIESMRILVLRGRCTLGARDNFNQDIAQPGRARARGARGHGIEARFPDHFGEAVASLPPFEPTAVVYHTYIQV